MEHEQVEKQVAHKSMSIYLPVSIGAALLFFLTAALTGDYPLVARVGGTIWVGLLSLIVSMPIVISRVKKNFTLFWSRNMSRIKVSKHSSAREVKKRKEWPVVVYLWIIGLAMVSYLFARIGLDAYPHPFHWLSGLAGGLAGIPIGWLWYRWRGDVF